MTRFYVGTAGWSYLQWDKEFYPKGIKSSEKLAYYAIHFNAVELNNSFYHTPTAEQFTNWESQVPAHFRFAIKASRYITHTRKLNSADQTVPRFLDSINLSNPGPVFFQLPPSFSLNIERLTAFLEQLPTGRRYAIELRDPSWHVEPVFKLLKKYKVAFCLFDTPEGISPRITTTNFSYVRLRGRTGRQLNSFLQEWHAWLEEHTNEAFVIFDNREEKRLAFGNALTFREML